jgi:XTP/dITP diphosphohydrolase
MADGSCAELELIPDFSRIPPFEELAPTFAENAAGKALYFSRFTSEIVLGDDSGLVVPALGGAPGVHSARYAGINATDEDRVRKLLGELGGRAGTERLARFVCVIALARQGRILAVFSDFVEGDITAEPRGKAGFGYDSVFFVPEIERTFAEASSQEKNSYSHRGKAFRKTLQYLGAPQNTLTLL